VITASIQKVCFQFLIIAPVCSGGTAHTKQPPLLINSFQAIAPLTGQKKEVHFLSDFCPLLATIQALSRTHVSLLSENEQKLLCMGRTFTAN
jgi:hypothetical protein